jgi:hypothetical protein
MASCTRWKTRDGWMSGGLQWGWARMPGTTSGCAKGSDRLGRRLTTRLASGRLRQLTQGRHIYYEE